MFLFQVILFIFIFLFIICGIILVQGYYKFGSVFEKKANKFHSKLDKVTNRSGEGKEETKEEKEKRLNKIKQLDKKRKKALKKLERKATYQVYVYNALMILRNKWCLMIGLLILFFILFLVVPYSKMFYKLVSNMIIFPDAKQYLISKSHLLLSVAKAINATATVFISVCLTIFTFTFRERKTISFSINTLSKNSWFFVVLMIIILNLIYGWLFINTAGTKETFLLVPVYANRLCIYLILTVISVFVGMYIIGELFKSIDLRHTLERTVKETKSLFLQHALSKKKHDYGQLRLYIESLYQLLSLSLEKNTGELFGQQFERWKEYLDEFHPGGTQSTESFLQNNIFDTLYTKNENEFKKVYKVLLQSHTELIINVIKTNKLSDIQKALEVYKNLSPLSTHDSLKKVYTTSLHELIIYVIENHANRLPLVLDVLEKYASIEVVEGKHSTLKIYKSLILKSCVSNTVKDLSQLVYSMLKILDSGDQLERNRDSLIQQKIPVLHVHDSRHDQRIENNKQASMFIIIQAAIKSIELSHYACIGFIVKMLVTVFNNDQKINEVFQLFCDKEATAYGQNNLFVKENNESSDVVVSTKFNVNTFEYCCNKFAILLYAQYKYAVKCDLPRSNHKNSSNKIDRDIIEIKSAINIQSDKYLTYLFEKIVKPKDKYGLLFLHDESFLDEFKKEIFLKLGLLYKKKNKYSVMIDNILKGFKE